VGGVILYVNRPLGRRSEEEVVGSQFTDWVFPDQHAAVRDAVGRVFATGRADGVELQGIQGHDPDSWFECRIAPNTREGKVVSVTIIARDVTRYKQTEKALVERTGILERELDDRRADLDLLRAQSAAADGGTRADTETLRFRAAIETAGEAVFLVDPDGEVLVDLNDTACRWLRRHRAELRGQPVAGLGLGFPLVPPAADPRGRPCAQGRQHVPGRSLGHRACVRGT
jgi:PAS domain S-box-containing protein